MESLSELFRKLRRKPTDVVGVGIGASAVSAVRLRKAPGGQVTVVASGIIHPDDTGTKAAREGGFVLPKNISLPSKLRARYACIAVASPHAVIKLLNFPGRFDESTEGKLVENLGLENPERFRVSYKVVREGHARTESRVLAAALPEEDAAAAISIFDAGIPAPYSLEIAGLAALGAFANGLHGDLGDGAVGVIEFGAVSTFVAFFHKGVPALVRQFTVGSETVLDRVRRELGVDAKTARGIIEDGAFDISRQVLDVFTPLIKQLAVSRDFVERREDCRIARIFLSGGMMAAREVVAEVGNTMELDVGFWNPFDGLAQANGAVPDSLRGKEWQLAGALGAGLATLQEEE